MKSLPHLKFPSLVVARHAALGGYGDDVYGLGIGIEHDLRFAAFKLPYDVSDLLVQRKIPLAVVRAFAQNERFDDPSQGVARKFSIRNRNRFLRFFVGKKGAHERLS